MASVEFFWGVLRTLQNKAEKNGKHAENSKWKAQMIYTLAHKMKEDNQHKIWNKCGHEKKKVTYKLIAIYEKW